MVTRQLFFIKQNTAYDVDIEIIGRCPAQNSSRDVGRTGSQIDDDDSLAELPGRAESLEMMKDRAGIAQRGVDFADKAKGAIELARIDVVLIEKFVAANPAVVNPIEHALILAERRLPVI